MMNEQMAHETAKREPQIDEGNMFEGVFYTDEQMESAHILMSGGMSIKDALADVMGR